MPYLQHSEPSLPEAEDEDRPLSASVARQQARSKHACSSRDLRCRPPYKKSSAPVDMDTIMHKVLQLNSRYALVFIFSSAFVK